MASFQERLKALRKKHNLKQKHVANKLGITESAYGYYEQGRREPSVDTLNQLAELFDVSVDYLVNGRIEREEVSLDKLLQEKIDDPDDYFFLDGYLDASENEKKEIRRYWFDLKKQMRENNVKASKPPSLFEVTESIKKAQKDYGSS